MLCLSAAQSKAILACHRANFSLMVGGVGGSGSQRAAPTQQILMFTVAICTERTVLYVEL